MWGLVCGILKVIVRVGFLLSVMVVDGSSEE